MKPPPPSILPQIILGVALFALAWLGVQFYKSYQLNKQQIGDTWGKKLGLQEESYLVSVQSVWIDSQQIWSQEFTPANQWVITGKVQTDANNNWELVWDGKKVWCHVDQSYGPYTNLSQLCDKIRAVKAIALEAIYCKQ